MKLSLPATPRLQPLNPASRARRAAGFALAVCGWAAGPALAQAQPAPPATSAAKPLSAEDEALVKELALVENIELLRNLDLFEPGQRANGERSATPPAPQPSPRQEGR